MLHLLDNWEKRYISNLKDNDYLAWSDEEATLRYPKHSWVYNKHLLSKHTGVYTVNLEKELPRLYPVVVKPSENLLGLSRACYVAESPDEIEDHQGFIAQEYLGGLQCSTDMMISKGKVQAHFSFVTQKSRYDEIKLFSSTPFFNHQVKSKIEQILFDYTGIANVEYIDEKIIEIHLRPSLQFFDICGGFIEAMPVFIRNGTLPSHRFTQTYSRVFRTRRDGLVYKVNIPEHKPEGVTSVQLCYEDGKLLSHTDPSLFRKRFMVINGTDLNTIENYGSLVEVYVREI